MDLSTLPYDTIIQDIILANNMSRGDVAKLCLNPKNTFCKDNGFWQKLVRAEDPTFPVIEAEDDSLASDGWKAMYMDYVNTDQRFNKTYREILPKLTERVRERLQQIAALQEKDEAEGYMRIHYTGNRVEDPAYNTIYVATSIEAALLKIYVGLPLEDLVLAEIKLKQPSDVFPKFYPTEEKEYDFDVSEAGGVRSINSIVASIVISHYGPGNIDTDWIESYPLV